MKRNILVDIDVISEYLKTGKGVLPKAYEKFNMHICAATYIQLLASETFKDESLEKEVVDFLKKYFKFLPISEDNSVQASKVIRDSGLTLGSALVVACAKTHSMPLLTNDKAQFSKVESLEFIDVE